jgi:hypothetical protein
MGGPGWLADIFAALMLTVAVYCTARLVVARRLRRPTEVDTDGAHVVMGVAMAGMLVTGLRTLPTGMWEGVFAVGAGWFGWRMVQARRDAARSPWRCLHPVPHLVECAAMLFMLGVLPASIAVRSAARGMSGMTVTPTESRFSFLALVLALFMFGYVAWVGDRLTLRTPALALPGQASLLPAPAAAPTPPAAAGPAGDPAASRLAAAGPVAAGPVANGPAASGPVAAGPVANGPAASGSGPGEQANAVARGCGESGSALRYLAPRCSALCKITMGVTMGYMLILML